MQAQPVKTETYHLQKCFSTVPLVPELMIDRIENLYGSILLQIAVLEAGIADQDTISLQSDG